METTHAKPRFVHWIALALLVISVCINYADRGNLGVAARSMQRELHFSQQELGILLASFSLRRFSCRPLKLKTSALEAVVVVGASRALVDRHLSLAVLTSRRFWFSLNSRRS